MKRAFGESTYNHIVRIIYGSNDPLSCAPEAIMVRICSMLDLQSVSRLAQVNRYLRKLCTSDKLWSLLYAQHQGLPTHEITYLANDIGWKKVFYLSKLQLQKELSRRRSQNPARLSTMTSPRGPNTNETATLSPRGSATGDTAKLHPRGSATSEVGAKLDLRGSTTSEASKLNPRGSEVGANLQFSASETHSRGSAASEILPKREDTQLPQRSASCAPHATGSEATTFLTEKT